jgi:hypothetical protein
MVMAASNRRARPATSAAGLPRWLIQPARPACQVSSAASTGRTR